MLRTMFSTTSLVLCAALCLAGLSAAQDSKIRDHRKGYDPNMQRAMDSVFGTKRVEQLEIRDHKFNFKPAKFTVSNTMAAGSNAVTNSVTIKGQFSHFLRLRDDDEVHYTIRKRNGQITDIEVSVDGSSMQGALNSVKKVFVDNPKLTWELLTGSPSKPGTKPAGPKAQLTALEMALREVDDLKADGWQGVARLIIANIAVRADSKGRDGMVWLRKSAGPPPPVKSGK